LTRPVGGVPHTFSKGACLGDARVDRDAAVTVARKEKTWVTEEPLVNGREPVKVPYRVLRNPTRVTEHV